MKNRVLTRITVSFLLGILSARYGNPGVYGIWRGCLLWLGIWVCWMAWLGVTAWQQAAQEASGPHMCGRQTARQPGREKAGYRAVWYIWMRLAACLLGGLLGFLQWGRQQAGVLAVELYLSDKEDITVAGTLSKKEEKNGNIVYDLKDSYIICENGYLSCNQIQIYLNADEYSIGDTIQIKGACESFDTACNEGNFDAKAYYYSKNILFRVKADSIRLVHRQRFLWQEKLYQLRKSIQEVYVQQLPEQEAGVLAVMTLGEKGLLDTEIKKLYQQSGFSHVLAISGLHISILGMGLYRFLRKRGASYVWAGLSAGCIVLIFGQISGMELSTVRAVTMFAVMLLGNMLGMAYDSVTALSFSALLQLWENPFGLWNTGFLFSYSAVLAVVVAAKVLMGREAGRSERDRKKQAYVGERIFAGKGLLARNSRRLAGWKRNMRSTLFMSSCIQLVTLPLTVYFYYEFPVYSVCINGLLLPFMGVLLSSGILGGLTGLLFGIVGGPAGLAAKWMSWLLLQPAYGLLKWNEWICGQFQKLPGSVWITGKPPLWMMIGYYAILAVALGMLSRKNGGSTDEKRAVGKKGKAVAHPGVGQCVGRAMPLAAICAALLMLLAVRPARQFQICFLDVGQGDGICIQTENGEIFFIDGGSTSENKVGEYRILSFLKCRGAGYVDGWFVSHADNDHVSGLKEIWESGYRIKNLFLAEEMIKDEAWEELCALARHYQTDITYLRPGDVVGSENAELTCLFPWEEKADRNCTSLVLKLEVPGMTAFFPGDISKAEEQELVSRCPGLRADLYKAAHHGSNGSNSADLLEQLSSVVTVVSCGKDNRYGHPGAEAVERITASGSRIFYTMEGGQITVGCGEEGIWVREYKSELFDN